MDILPSLQSRTLVVVFTSRSTIIPSLIAELALLGPVSVLDGGNCFPAYRTAKLIRRKSNQLEAISKRIFLRRALQQREFSDWSMGFVNLDTVNAEQIPGYSTYLNTSLTSAEFEQEGFAFTFLRVFKQMMVR